jgi:hypothetical protein
LIWVARVSLVIILALTFSSGAGICKDARADLEQSEETLAPTTPRLYLDVSATYASIPASSFAIGFRNSFSLANLTSLSAQSVALSLPVTVDVSDRLSIYAGLNTYASRSEGYSWSSMVVDSWSAGFQFVAYEQNGGHFPSVTVQSTYTQSISGVLSASGTGSVVEFGYALNEDETYGLLAGIKYANIVIDSAALKVGSSTIGYAGAYYQSPENWKLTGRLGLQAFEGANLGSLLQVKPFTLPIIRLDLDRMTDDDQIRFGMTAEIAWSPNPVVQLTVRTPITLR